MRVLENRWLNLMGSAGLAPSADSGPVARRACGHDGCGARRVVLLARELVQHAAQLRQHPRQDVIRLERDARATARP